MAMYQVQTINNVKTLVPVSGDVSTDSVTDNDMHPVTSNAVASALGTNYDDSEMVDITNLVTKYAGVTTVKAYRKQNMVYLFFSGTYTGTPTSGTQGFVDGLPSKYRPPQEFNGFAMGGYNGNGAIFGRGSVSPNGTVLLQETAWTNGAAIRSCMIYFV